MTSKVVKADAGEPTFEEQLAATRKKPAYRVGPPVEPGLHEDARGWVLPGFTRVHSGDVRSYVDVTVPEPHPACFYRRNPDGTWTRASDLAGVPDHFLLNVRPLVWSDEQAAWVDPPEPEPEVSDG